MFIQLLYKSSKLKTTQISAKKKMDKLRYGHTTEHSSVKVITTGISNVDESRRRKRVYTLCFCLDELLEQVKLVTEVEVRVALTS